jgi:transcription-repair coupling factor (superfamily II helicase)
MNEDLLERTVNGLLAQRVRRLVCTTIVENGWTSPTPTR